MSREILQNIIDDFSPEKFPLSVQLISMGLQFKAFHIPPPPLAAELPVNTQLISVGLQWLAIAIPPALSPAELPMNLQSDRNVFVQ